MKNAAAIIPARYDSSRFPGKPLAIILGKPLIQRVYEGVRQARAVGRVIIATDDPRIYKAAKDFGAEVAMTSARHSSGTERVAEVAAKLDAELVINVQVDEPLVSGEMVDRLVEALSEPGVLMASLMARVFDLALINDPHIVKVVADEHGNALYFSRSPLPYHAADFFYQHIGIYGYERRFLLDFAKLPPSRLERQEKLEQLRALEHGNRIRMVEARFSTLSVDTPEDIIKVEERLGKRT